MGRNLDKRKYQKFRINKNNKEYKKSKTVQIKRLIENGNLKFAKEDIDNYISEYGEDCYVLHELARYHDALNDISKAKELYYKNIENNGANKSYSMYEVAKLEKKSKNYEKAEELLVNLIIYPNNNEKDLLKFELGKLYLEIENFIQAEPLFYELLYSKTDNQMIKDSKEHICIELISIKLRLGKVYDAKFIYEKFKDTYDLRQAKGRIEIETGNYIQARETFEQLYNDGIDKVSVLSSLIEIELELLNFDKVIEYATEMSIIDSSRNTDSLIVLANCYIKIGNFDKSMEYINKLIEDDKIGAANLLIGESYFYKNEYEKAIENFEKIDSKWRKHYCKGLYFTLCGYIKQEEYEKAYEVLNKLKEVDNNRKYHNLYYIQLYLEQKLNIESNIVIKKYIDEQINDYSKEKAIKHIKLHKYGNVKKSFSIFDNEIDINELFMYCEKNLNEKTFCYNTFLDIYKIPYSQVGMHENCQIDVVKVATLPNTKDIITIYPISKYERFINNKVKRMTQIDKFNKKYSIK